MVGKIYHLLLSVQGWYTLLTALWGILDIDSFMAVTGPKTDIWLVKTVSVVLAAVGICLISHRYVSSHAVPAILLGFFCSAGLGFIDVYYYAAGVISWVYLLDAFAEGLFAAFWVFLFIHRTQLEKTMGTRAPGT